MMGWPKAPECELPPAYAPSRTTDADRMDEVQARLADRILTKKLALAQSLDRQDRKRLTALKNKRLRGGPPSVPAMVAARRFMAKWGRYVDFAEYQESFLDAIAYALEDFAGTQKKVSGKNKKSV